MESDANLLVSSAWKAPGRARREIVGRLRALGDPAPLVSPTGRKGVVSVRTALDAREVIRRLHAMHDEAPGRFRYTFKWVPVDLWTTPDVPSLRQAVTRLRERIAPGERWRMTVERRADGSPPAAEIIAALADLVDRKVDLTRPDKILLVELFEHRAALAALGAGDTFIPAAGPAPPPAVRPATVEEGPPEG
jgi:tRNA acetyltransferase TAN1